MTLRLQLLYHRPPSCRPDRRRLLQYKGFVTMRLLRLHHRPPSCCPRQASLASPQRFWDIATTAPQPTPSTDHEGTVASFASRATVGPITAAHLPSPSCQGILTSASLPSADCHGLPTSFSPQSPDRHGVPNIYLLGNAGLPWALDMFLFTITGRAELPNIVLYNIAGLPWAPGMCLSSIARLPSVPHICLRPSLDYRHDTPAAGQSSPDELGIRTSAPPRSPDYRGLTTIAKRHIAR